MLPGITIGCSLFIGAFLHTREAQEVAYRILLILIGLTGSGAALAAIGAAIACFHGEPEEISPRLQWATYFGLAAFFLAGLAIGYKTVLL